MTDRVWFTPLLNQIADVAGERAALVLGRDKACQAVYIPSAMPAGDHWLVQLVGADAAKAIVREFAGHRLEIPPAIAGQKRRRRMAIAEMTRKGYSTNAITRALGIARSTVKDHRRRIRDEEPEDDAQGSLF